jgi:hypothetical protein
MKSIKRLMPILIFALVAILMTPQAFAGTGEIAGKAAPMPTGTSGMMAAILNYFAVIFQF